MQMSGGHLLVAGLDGDNTIIYSNPSSSFKTSRSSVLLFLTFNKIRNDSAFISLGNIHMFSGTGMGQPDCDGILQSASMMDKQIPLLIDGICPGSQQGVPCFLIDKTFQIRQSQMLLLLRQNNHFL